jgi:hypothetical protein
MAHSNPSIPTPERRDEKELDELKCADALLPRLFSFRLKKLSA